MMIKSAHHATLKTWSFVVMSFLTAASAFSQAPPPAYKQNKFIPGFELQLVDNTVFSSAKLKKNVPLIIMFFSPTCDHCIHQFEDFVKNMNQLKKIQIVMATYQPIEELREFSKKYQLTKYPNITAGRDTKFFFPPFYQIRNFPYLAFYDRQGKLIDTFEGNMTIPNIVKKFQ